MQIRFIPTGVGNAKALFDYSKKRAVHPHGCGERRIQTSSAQICNGSSPRVWGTLVKNAQEAFDERFIPTGVGNAHLETL